MAQSFTSGFSATESPICSLCVAVADGTRCGEPLLYNRKLLETDRFLVLPSLGPLVPGHVMVVSKEHRSSLASMGRDAIEEYDQLAKSLKTAPFMRDGEPLQAEHGSTANDKAGACVVHTHIHWLPGLGSYMAQLQKRFTSLTERFIGDVPPNVPYIFLRSGDETTLVEAKGLPSQTIRRVLCGLLDRDDTDWKQVPRLDWVKETVHAWQSEM